ncbi:MAG: 50S ribosomal protein L21 [Christensenellaceae bacterium]|jgi:large subunit ribosomal protein L21|nr:50S ribosomal protein L21 [Christensenellaceae bacterium]
MYAIIKTGGKQYRVSEGELLKVELLDAQIGDKIKLDVILLADDDKFLTGNDSKDAYVLAEVLGAGRGRKLHIFTYKPKKNVRKRQGHRQPYTQIKILQIVG